MITHTHPFDLYFQLVTQLQKEDLKIARPQQSVVSDPNVETQDIGQLDSDLDGAIASGDFECCAWNPLQLIGILNKIKQCLDRAPVQTSSVNEASTVIPCSYATPSYCSHIGYSTCVPVVSSINTPLMRSVVLNSAQPAFSNTTGLTQSAFCSHSTTGNTTDYLDTLRSLNTITTEYATGEAQAFQALQTNQIQQQLASTKHQIPLPDQYQVLHHYHVYDSNGHSPESVQQTSQYQSERTNILSE